MTKNAHLYDTPDYLNDHLLQKTANKVLGKMKDECAGRPVAESIGLRPKIYSILETNGKNIKKVKSVKKTTVKSTLGMSSIERLSLKGRSFAMASPHLWATPQQGFTVSL